MLLEGVLIWFARRGLILFANIVVLSNIFNTSTLYTQGIQYLTFDPMIRIRLGTNIKQTSVKIDCLSPGKGPGKG